jgi:hypothetical protein
MTDAALVNLMSDLARLLSRRSSTPRGDALSIAHRKIRSFAAVRQLSEDWCDAVMLAFVAQDRSVVAA